jgi:hypothetical protein
MLKKPFMKTAPLALAVTAAFFLGGVAHAQTGPAGVSTPGGAMSQAQAQKDMPAGTTKPQDNAVMPGPTAGTGTTRAAPSSSGMSGSSPAATDGSIAGTTKAKDNIANPAPMAGTAKTAEMRNDKVKKSHKKSMRNKSTSESSNNDMGKTTGEGTK